MLDQYLKHYTHTFEHESWIRGQTTQGSFTLDFKNTHDPWVSNGYADFRFVGELLADTTGGKALLQNHTPCDDFSPKYLSWYGDHIESQLVISSAAASCAMESISKTPIGKFHLDKKTLSQAFGLNYDEIELNSTSIKTQLSIF